MRHRFAEVGSPVSFVFTLESLEQLLADREGPCVSIYFPSHRRKTDSRSDSILYRNLCREVEKMLTRDETSEVSREISHRLRALDEPAFWEHGSEGTAVFAAPDYFAAYRLPVEFPQLEVVGGSFHTKPVIRYLQSGTGYWLLVVSLHGVTLYDGWRKALQPVPLNGVPSSVEDIPGVEGSSSARGESRMHHAVGGGGDEGRADVERFFREISKGLSRGVLRGSTKPLILAAQKQHQSLFRKVASLPTLVADGIAIDGGSRSTDSLAESVLELLRPVREKRVAAANEEFALALSRGHASSSMGDIARAAAQGRVKRLCVESGRRCWGMLDRSSGDIVPGEEHKNAYDVDLYDELAELTIGHGGDALVLKSGEMPTQTGIAAVYRY